MLAPVSTVKGRVPIGPLLWFRATAAFCGPATGEALGQTGFKRLPKTELAIATPADVLQSGPNAVSASLRTARGGRRKSAEQSNHGLDGGMFRAGFAWSVEQMVAQRPRPYSIGIGRQPTGARYSPVRRLDPSDESES